MPSTARPVTLPIVCFAVLGVTCFIALSVTLWNQPLFAFRTQDTAWLQAWLWMTVLDYYGACLPLCAVIFANETSHSAAILWSLACCLGGSPFCCLWVVLQLLSDRPHHLRFP